MLKQFSLIGFTLLLAVTLSGCVAAAAGAGAAGGYVFRDHYDVDVKKRNDDTKNDTKNNAK